MSWFLLAAFALLSFSFKVGSYPLTDRDEALYSEVARECLDTGDWWTLHWQQKPWFIHAPLAMWIQATGFRSLGVSELTARLPSVLFGVALVLLTAAFGAMLFDRRTGLMAGWILASCPIFYIIARMAILDMSFAFFITLSIFLFVRAWRKNDYGLYAAFWLATGLATLCKGLWGLALPMMVSFLYAVTDRDRRRLLDWRLYASMPVWAAVVAPWLIVGTMRHGREFLEPVLVTNTYARLTTSVCTHKGPWWFYVPIILVGLSPWIVLWPGAFFKRKGDAGRLLLLWIVPALILYSSARTKLPNYVLPLVPALAIMLAAAAADSKRRLAQGIALPVLGVGIAVGVIFGMRAFEGMSSLSRPVELLAIIGGAYSLAGFALIRFRNSGVAIAAILLTGVLTLIPLGYMKVSSELSPKEIALHARSHAGNAPIMIAYGVSCEDGIYFYGREPFVRADSFDELARVMRVAEGDYVLILSEGQLSDLSERGFKLRILDRSRKWILARRT
jgi:4-amino-4-deoxy-L-arabinose transferase-like glycosyltransferase